MEIARRLIKLIHNCDMNEDRHFKKYIEFVEDRKYNDKRYNISFNKLLSLGWKQETFIDEGLKKTFEHYKKIYEK
jgi:dTDP-D-glucose 4,6-dehydratase